jgi:hypothetical protein
MDLVKYTTDENAYSNTQRVESNCNTLQFINYGTNDVLINNVIPLITNQTFTIEGNAGEICVRTFTLAFIDTGGTNNCVVIKKNYLK